MKKPKQSGPFPWDDPEYRFLKPGWPPNFVSQFQTADLATSSKLSKSSSAARTRLIAEGGEKGVIARGTLPGPLSNRGRK